MMAKVKLPIKFSTKGINSTGLGINLNRLGIFSACFWRFGNDHCCVIRLGDLKGWPYLRSKTRSVWFPFCKSSASS